MHALTHNSHTFDILIMNLTTKVFSPDMTSPSLQNTDCSQALSWMSRNSRKWLSSTHEGSLTPHSLQYCQYLLHTTQTCTTSPSPQRYLQEVCCGPLHRPRLIAESIQTRLCNVSTQVLEHTLIGWATKLVLVHWHTMCCCITTQMHTVLLTVLTKSLLTKTYAISHNVTVQ